MAYDDHWKRLRAVVSPTFSTGKLRRMRPLIEDCLQTLLKNLDQKSAENPEIDMKLLFGAYTMEVVIQVAFGTKVDALIDENNPIIVNARKLFSTDISIFMMIKFIMFFTLPQSIKKHLKGLQLFQKEVMDFWTDFTKKIIKERKQNNSGIKRFVYII